MKPEGRPHQVAAVPKPRKYLIVGVSPPIVAKTAAEPPRPVEDLDDRAVRLFSKSRRELIAEAAYYRAQRRGFHGGDSREDWYEAEAEVERRLLADRPF